MSASRFASFFGGFSRALSVRDYRIYWIGQCISVQGVWVWRIAVGVLTFQLTQSPAWLGFIALAYFLPVILIGPIAGAFADQFGHRRTAIATLGIAIVIAFVMAALTFAGLMTPYLLAALVILLGVGHAFDFPARQVLIQHLVGRDRMSAAIAVNSTTFNMAAFTGPAIGAALLAFGRDHFGDAAPAVGFVVFGLGSMWFTASLIRIHARDAARKSTRVGKLAADVKDGAAYIWRHDTIRTILLNWIPLSFLMRAYVDLLPGFAFDVFGRGDEGLGTLLAASGAGALVVSIILGVRGRMRGLPQLYVVSTLASTLAVMAFAATTNFWVASAAMVVAGGFIVAGAISTQTLVQATVAPEFRGRVVSIYLSLAPSAQSVGAFAVGWLAEFIGLQWAVGIAAGLSLLIIAWGGHGIWRRARTIEDEANDPPPAVAPLPDADKPRKAAE
jgi:MFS family permease